MSIFSGTFVRLSRPPGCGVIEMRQSPDVFGLTDATSNAGGIASGVCDWAASNSFIASAATIAAAAMRTVLGNVRVFRIITFKSLIGRRLLDMVDDKNVDWPFRRFQLESELFLDGRENRGAAGIDGGQRWRPWRRGPLRHLLRCP
jgi:hypothetical protein